MSTTYFWNIPCSDWHSSLRNRIYQTSTAAAEGIKCVMMDYDKTRDPGL